MLKIKYINNEVKFVEKPKVGKKKEKVETKVEVKETKKVEEVVKSDELPQDFIQIEPEVIVEPEILPQENEEIIIKHTSNNRLIFVKGVELVLNNISYYNKLIWVHKD